VQLTVGSVLGRRSPIPSLPFGLGPSGPEGPRRCQGPSNQPLAAGPLATAVIWAAGLGPRGTGCRHWSRGPTTGPGPCTPCHAWATRASWGWAWAWGATAPGSLTSARPSRWRTGPCLPSKGLGGYGGGYGGSFGGGYTAAATSYFPSIG